VVGKTPFRAGLQLRGSNINVWERRKEKSIRIFNISVGWEEMSIRGTGLSSRAGGLGTDRIEGKRVVTMCAEKGWAGPRGCVDR